ncbi:MAG: DUF2865 domain-containing protein [Pseudomonadota bacterium]
MFLKLKKKISGVGKKLTGHHGVAVSVLCGGIVGLGVVGAWTFAVAQQPYPSQAPYPQPNTQGPPPGYQQAYPQPGYQGGAAQPSTQELRCAQLEHQLANDWVRRQQGRGDRRSIERNIRKFDRQYQTTQARAERQGCYRSNFIFGRSLVRTPKCVRLHRQVEEARRQLENLHAQRQAQRGGRNRQQAEVASALARAGCAPRGQRQARRGGGGLLRWFEEWDTSPRRDLQTSRIEQYATYRTLCVRSCDGYYFPVSFSTLPSNFSRDAAQCQSQCAAPADLYVYRNPGEEAEQMVSTDGARAYNELPNAWRYRKEYVKGCSCKTTEYDPDEIAASDQKADAGQSGLPAPEGSGSGAQFADEQNKPAQTQ